MKHSKKSYTIGNVVVRPITNNEFVSDMAKSKGVLCGAGFETPAEALYLRKKLMVIPMKGQFEQQCNAAALQEMGVPVIKNLKTKHFNEKRTWLDSDKIVEVNYPDHTKMVLRKTFELMVHTILDNNEYQEKVAPLKLLQLNKFFNFSFGFNSKSSSLKRRALFYKNLLIFS